MRRRFVTLDVFTERALPAIRWRWCSNPTGSTPTRCRRSRASSTCPRPCSCCSRDDPGTPRDVRIFTPARNCRLPAIPTVGTAVLLGCIERLRLGVHDMVLEETVGLVHCTVEAQGREQGRASFILPRLPEQMEGTVGADEAAAALGLNADDIGFGIPSRWSAGVPANCVPLRDLDAMARARPAASFDAVFGRGGPAIAYLYCGETRDPAHRFHARMFAPSLGIVEDPATGAAAAAFAGVVMAVSHPADGEHRFVIEQGYEMGRPSQIELGMTVQGGTLTRATIGGSAVIVSDGHIEA